MTVVENEDQIVEKYKEYKSAEKAGNDGTHRRILGGVVFQDLTSDTLTYQLRYGQDFWEVDYCVHFVRNLHLMNL